QAGQQAQRRGPGAEQKGWLGFSPQHSHSHHLARIVEHGGGRRRPRKWTIFAGGSRRPGPFDAASRRIYTDICTGQSCIAFNFAARGRRVNDIGQALARRARICIRTTWILAWSMVPAHMAVSLLARTPALRRIAKGAG